MAKNNHKDINLIKHKIYNLNLDYVVKRISNKYKWDIKEAKECEKLYKNFLFLNVLYKEDKRLVPTEEIDMFWHEHILHTKHYINHCEEIFGGYLQHDPLFDSEYGNIGALFEETQELHKKEFGYYMYDIRINFKYCLKYFLNKLKK